MLSDATTPAALHEGLNTHFGLLQFRPGQQQVIDSVLAGRNTVAVMPTGAGKSLCFQLPALLLDGVTVVVSPLIALMQDQVDALTAKGISATFINSTLSDSERAERQRNLRAGVYKLVYVAPERFRSESFVSALLDAKLALYAIDEAHCISQWGHDFRPDYALLGQVRKRLRPPRTIALTATATPQVQADIARVLLMKDPVVHVAGFDRPNLFLEVLSVSGDDEKRRACTALAEEGSGVVYCNTRKQAEAIHQHYLDEGISTVLYHAGLDDEARREAQESFMRAEKSVAVATNAFGMGIDKSDIRFVAHAGIPRAVEAYYQEIGRAGRDGKPAHAVLLFNHADVFTQERLIQSSHPSTKILASVWNVVTSSGGFQRGSHALALQAGANEFEVSAALKILEREGAISRGYQGEPKYRITLAAPAHHKVPRSAEARLVFDSVRALQAERDEVTLSLALEVLERKTALSNERVRHALTLLEKAELCTVTRPTSAKSIVPLREGRFDDLQLPLERLYAQQRNQLALLKQMTDFAYTKHCRRAHLLRYFGEQHAETGRCQGCDVCSGAKIQLKRATPPKVRKGLSFEDSSELPVDAPTLEALKRWRRTEAAEQQVAPFIIFNDATLRGLASRLPVTQADFLAVKGSGPLRWEKYGAQVVRMCREARERGARAPVTRPVSARALQRGRT